jgi:indolepyruvate ferredoxin oxidoreductase beta subunit
MGRIMNVIVAGLGGQGAIKASDILADAAARAGHDVKKAEIHGMSQRGGSVTSDDQVEVNRPLVREGGLLIGPDFVDENSLPNKRSLNVALLGALSHHLDIPEALWMEAVRAALPERLHGVNETAFRLGREKAASVARRAG